MTPRMRLLLRLGGWLGLVLAVSWACRIASPTTPATPDAQATVAAAVQATLAAATGLAPQPTAPPTAQPTAVPTPALAAQPAYVWAYRDDTDALVLYDAQGQAVLSVPVSAEGLLFPVAPAHGLHTLAPIPPAGPYDMVVMAAGALHRDNKEMIHTLDAISPGGSRTELRVDGNLAGIAGIPETPRVAYAVWHMVGYQYQSALYVHTVGTAPPTRSLLEMRDDEGWGLLPVGMDTHGVWVTRAVSGAPLAPRGLSLVDFTGQEHPLLDATFVGLDPVAGWVAYSPAPGTLAWQPVQSAPTPALVGNPVTVPEPVFPVDQGAIFIHAAFSSGYVAWQVHIGTPMEGWPYLRVYTLDGQPVAVQNDQGPDPAADVFEGPPWTWVRTAAGQDYVVLGGRRQSDGQEVLLFVTPDLSQTVAVVPGHFMGVAYPAR